MRKFHGKPLRDAGQPPFCAASVRYGPRLPTLFLQGTTGRRPPGSEVACSKSPSQERQTQGRWTFIRNTAGITAAASALGEFSGAASNVQTVSALLHQAGPRRWRRGGPAARKTRRRPACGKRAAVERRLPTTPREKVRAAHRQTPSGCWTGSAIQPLPKTGPEIGVAKPAKVHTEPGAAGIGLHDGFDHA